VNDPLELLGAPLVDAAAELAGANSHDALLERPSDLSRGDYATSLALRLAKPVRRAPTLSEPKISRNKSTRAKSISTAASPRPT